MGKPKTLKDLMIAGEITNGMLDVLARDLFNDDHIFPTIDSLPYDIFTPIYDDLPEHVRGFIRKAILESTVKNILED